MKNTNARFWAYLVLAIVGLVTAMVFNGMAVMQQADYLDAWFGTSVDWVLSADLSVVAIAAAIFMIVEGRRVGVKRVWLILALSGVTAMAFTFPLFLALRERAMSQSNPRP